MSLEHSAGSLETTGGDPEVDGLPITVPQRANASPIRRVGGAVGGPALIVAGVLIVLHDFAFGGKISSQHVDQLAYQLPLWCFMGRSLSSGHIPAWNPYALGGFPSSVDADSGWMYLPVMALFTALPCGTAMEWFIVLQPVIGGLGLYWFLRGEGVSRLASTFGGLALSLGAAGAMLTIYLPFAALMAWIPVLLGAASRCLRSATWPRRLVWAALVAVVWGQVAAAFLGSGIVLGTAALVIYGVARTRVEVREGRLGKQDAAWLWAALTLALPMVNLAFLLPRLVILSRTSISFGYGQLQGLGGSLSGPTGHRRLVGPTANPYWPLKLAMSPGMYLGALPLAFSFAGWWSRRHRYLVIALSAMGAISYAATERAVATHLFAWVRSAPLSDVYFHSPVRFAYLLVPAMAGLAAIGFEAWRESGSIRSRIAMLVPGVVLWGGLLLKLGAPFWWVRFLLAGAVAGGVILGFSLRWPRLLMVIPLLLAAELVRSDLVGQATHRDVPLHSVAGAPLRTPAVDAETYLDAGPIGGAIRSRDAGRFLSLAPRLVTHRGYLTHQGPGSWGLLANQRGMLFGLEDVQGYNSIQLRRFWRFVEAVSPMELDYNAGVFPDPPPVALDLLQVRWVVGPSDRVPLGGLTPVTADRGWTLYEVDGAPPRASVIPSWRRAAGWSEALDTVLAEEFDPGATVILEQDPGLGPPGVPGRPGTASYRATGDQSASVVVDASSPSVVLVRNIYDPGWHATVDGQPAPVLAADYLVQGIPVGPGHHLIRLTYDDPFIGYGLLGSGGSLAALLGAALLLRRRQRRSPMRPGLTPQVKRKIPA